jgi:NADPH-dependent 7-cyano-7-deazaguanine reductase QueF
MADLLSTRDAARQSGYCQGYITQRAKAGAIKAQKIGKQWVLDKTSFETWLTSRQQRRTPQDEATSNLIG